MDKHQDKICFITYQHADTAHQKKSETPYSTKMLPKREDKHPINEYRLQIIALVRCHLKVKKV